MEFLKLFKVAEVIVYGLNLLFMMEELADKLLPNALEMVKYMNLEEM